MTAQELNDSLCRLWPMLDLSKTVDRVIAGDPGVEVSSVAVCWMPYTATLRNAAVLGANVVVAHEPTFYDHFELRQSPEAGRLADAKAAKQAVIKELGLTIIRCHDVWDAKLGDGVPFEWARFLGLTDLVASKPYLHVYAVDPAPAYVVAQKLASKTAAAGQSTLEFYGDPDRLVSTIGIGTGCCSEPSALWDMGADLAVAVDDILRCWIYGEYAADTGNPLVVVNHGVSEACAMGSLAVELQRIVPGTPVHEIKQGASYREIRSVQ